MSWPATCAAHLPTWACGLGEIGLYLAPSMALAFLIWLVTRLHPAFFLLSAVGTFCHELAHFGVGLLLGAEPIGFTIIPRGKGRRWELGSVTFANLRWYNAAPAALAPFLILFLPLAVAWWRTRMVWHFGPVDLALTLLLAPQFLSFWPSPVDWKLAVRSWPYLLIIAAVAIVWYWHPASVFRFVKA